MKLKEELVSFETAVLARIKGFLHQGFSKAHYFVATEVLYVNKLPYEHDTCVLAPTQSELQKWLREEHNCHIMIELPENPDADYFNAYGVEFSRGYANRGHIGVGSTYEETLDVALYNALKTISLKEIDGVKEEYVVFETAVLAKEKGFKEFTNYVYNQYGKQFIFNNGLLSGCERIQSPTQSLLQRWLREIHGINVTCTTAYINGKYVYECEIMYNGLKEIQVRLSQIHETDCGNSTYELTYEKALEGGLISGLKLIEKWK